MTLSCLVEASLEIIGGKWKALILLNLLGGPRRFNELRSLLPKVTQRMLTRQLHELEQDKLVERTIYPEVPPRVEYSLTEFGLTVEPNLRLLQRWGRLYLAEINALRQSESGQAARKCNLQDGLTSQSPLSKDSWIRILLKWLGRGLSMMIALPCFKPDAAVTIRRDSVTALAQLGTMPGSGESRKV